MCQVRVRFENSWIITNSTSMLYRILKHLELLDVKARPPPKSKKSSQVTETVIDYSDSQPLPSDDSLFYDPDYPVEDYAS